MTLSDAVLTRTSQRSYLPDPISPRQREELQKAIDSCNQRSGLRLQLVCGRPEPFASLRRSYGLLKGVHSYLALAGPAADPDLAEKCGYFGEELVLTAAAMGLGTCWVGGTYDKDSCLCHLREGEQLICVAAVGHTPEERGGREKLIALASKRKSKSQSELARNMSGAPSWFMSGIASVQRAPSARNRQGYRFLWQEDGTVRAQVTERSEFSMVDLGGRRRVPEGGRGEVLRRGGVAGEGRRAAVPAGPAQRRALELSEGARGRGRAGGGDSTAGDS